MAMGRAPDNPDAPTKVTVGAFASPGSPWWNDWQTFKANVEARSAGSVDVKLLINGEAGGEPASMTYVRRNRLNIGGFTLGGTSAIIPEVDVMLVPFFFDSVEEVDFILDTYLLDVFRDLFAQKGLYLLQWTEVGWLNVYGVEPILRPSDAKGQRMRVQSTEAAEVFMQSLGSEYLQMEFADVIPSLQTGLIYGGETNLVLYQVTGLAGEAPHMTFTRHTYDTGTVVANLNWFNALPPARRKIIEDSLVPTPQARINIRSMANTLRGSLASSNVIGHPLSTADRAAWKQATKTNHLEIIRRAGGRGQEVYDAMVAGKKAFKARMSSR
ncbi:MAG: TRAP transporter substrate-binding protein DctP [Pseudomonadota bacterium]